MVKGLKSLTRKLEKTIPARVLEASVAAMEQGADEIVALMKSLVSVDEGDLRDSIGWTWGDAPGGSLVLGRLKYSGRDGLKITIFAGGKFDGKDAFHVFWQEFGTQNHAPSPFFFVSYRRLKRRVKGRNTRMIKKAIKEGAR